MVSIQRLLRPQVMLRAALWVALAIEGAIALWISRPWVFGDNVHYLVLADSLAGGVYGSETAAGFEPDAVRPPGYPLLLLVLRELLRLPLATIAGLQVLVYLLTLLLVSRFIQSRGISPILFLLLAAAYPASFMYSANIVAEPWTTLFVTVAALLLCIEQRRPWTYVSAGLLCGLAALFRSDLLLVPIVVGAIVFFRASRAGRGIGPAIAQASLPVFAAAALLLPYSLWNFVHFDRLVPTPAAGAAGTSLYLATWQNELPQEDIGAFYKRVATPRAEQAGLADEVRSMNAQLGVDPLYPPWVPGNYPDNSSRIGITKLAGDLAVERIRRDPGAYAEHVIRNVWRLWHSESYPAALPAVAVVALKLVSAGIVLFGAVGIALSFLRPRGWPIAAAPSVVLLSVLMVHVWLHTEARYTASVRPILMMLAAAAIWWCCARAGSLWAHRQMLRRSHA